MKKARKANKAAGIKKGDSYYWWKFRYGGKHCSLTRPRPSQLTQSEFLSTLFGIEESISDISVTDADGMQQLADELSSHAEEVRSLGCECSDKASNMENAFPSGSPTIDLLNERSEACDRIADELETAASDAESKISEAEGDADFDWEGEASSIIESIDWGVE